MALNSFVATNRLMRVCAHIRCSSTSANARSQRKEIDVYGAKMSFIDTENHPEHAVIFLHGNPTSSYLWRNIIPHVSGVARCLAPDLIGMGKSAKVDGLTYTFQDHFKYFSKWMKSVDLPQKVNLVVHDWGSGLGFHWATLNPDNVQSITHMESLVCPMPSWDSFPGVASTFFQTLRSPDGDELILKQNLFVELLLPRSIMRTLTDEEMSNYLEPFKEPGESRRPTLTWPREIPIATDGPEDVVKFATNWYQWLATSKDIPKLYVNAEPGFFSPQLLEVTKDWPNQKVVTVKGLHFVQEDSYDEVGQAIKKFLLDSVF